MTQDIARARAHFEQAERESDPDLKAQALEEALIALASLDPEEISERERALIGNLRMAHTRRLLAQLVSLRSVSMDAWLAYVSLLLGDLKPEVDALTAGDPELRESYAGFLGLWGERVAEIVKNQESDPR